MEFNNLRRQVFIYSCFLGSYTATAGIPEIVHRVSEFIMRRDGGISSNPENIYISPGSQWAVQVSPPNMLFSGIILHLTSGLPVRTS